MSLTYNELPESVRSIYPWPGEDHEVAPGVHQHYVDVGAGDLMVNPLLSLEVGLTWDYEVLR